jgi:hypothetical protein
MVDDPALMGGVAGLAGGAAGGTAAQPRHIAAAHAHTHFRQRVTLINTIHQ